MTVAVDAVVYYRISNATIAISNVEDYGHSTRLLAATTLRNVLGTKNLSEILSERETISHTMQVILSRSQILYFFFLQFDIYNMEFIFLRFQSTLDEATDPWGVKVERVEM